MTVEGLVIWLIIGAIAGWLAGLIMKGYGFGLVGNIVVGIVGAVIAGWLLPRIGFVFIGGIGAEIINAVIGAVVLLAVIALVKGEPENRSSTPDGTPGGPKIRSRPGADLASAICGNFKDTYCSRGFDVRR